MNQVCTRRWSRTLGCTGISLRGMAVVLVHLLPQFVKILIDGGGRGTSVNCHCSLWAPTVEGVLTIGTEETAELLIWHMRILAGLAHTPMSTSSISNFQFPPPNFCILPQCVFGSFPKFYSDWMCKCRCLHSIRFATSLQTG